MLYGSLRKSRENKVTSIEAIVHWTNCLRQDTDQATQIVPPEAHLEETDSRLLQMWEAKQSLQKRWKTQKLNRNLRKCIALLNREIETYAKELSQQHWHETCNTMDNQIGFGKTWHLLRHLLDPDNNKTVHRQNIHKLIHDYTGTEEELLREVANTHFPSPSSTTPGLHWSDKWDS